MQVFECVDESGVVVVGEASHVSDTEYLVGHVAAVRTYPDAVFVLKNLEYVVCVGMEGVERRHAVCGTFRYQFEGQFLYAAAKVACLLCAALYFGIYASFGFYLAQSYINLDEGLYGWGEGRLSALPVLESQLQVEVHAHGVMTIYAFNGFR